MTEQDLIAEIDAVISDMTSATGRPPPVSWVENELRRRYPMPPDLDPVFQDGAIAGFRLAVRSAIHQAGQNPRISAGFRGEKGVERRCLNAGGHVSTEMNPARGW
jgi:hypothetical protein